MKLLAWECMEVLELECGKCWNGSVGGVGDGVRGMLEWKCVELLKWERMGL